MTQLFYQLLLSYLMNDDLQKKILDGYTRRKTI